MISLDRENMAKGVKKRFGALSEYEQGAVEAIMEAWNYSLKDALDVVERGDYEFYPEITSIVDLAHKLAETAGWLAEYIDYERLGADLYHDNYRETSLGVIQIA